MRTEVISII